MSVYESLWWPIWNTTQTWGRWVWGKKWTDLSMQELVWCRGLQELISTNYHFFSLPPLPKNGDKHGVSSMETRAMSSAFSAKEIQIFSCSQCSTPGTLASQCSTPSTSNGTVAETGRVTSTSQDTVARSDDHTALSHLPGMRWRPVFLVKAIRMLILRWEMFCWAFRVNFW